MIYGVTKALSKYSQKEIVVEAENIDDAIDIARGKYRNSEVVLDGDDFEEVEFTV